MVDWFSKKETNIKELFLLYFVRLSTFTGIGKVKGHFIGEAKLWNPRDRQICIINDHIDCFIKLTKNIYQVINQSWKTPKIWSTNTFPGAFLWKRKWRRRGIEHMNKKLFNIIRKRNRSKPTGASYPLSYLFQYWLGMPSKKNGTNVTFRGGSYWSKCYIL